MKTLQTGTKVLIEATVLQIDSSPNALLPYLIKLNTGDQYWTALKDLTVCETAEEKPALWKVHKSDPDFEKVYNAIKNGFDEEGRRAKYDDLIFIGKGPLPVTWTEEDRYIQAYPTITGQQALKLLGVSKPIDLQNFCIDITDPVNAELLPGFKEWVNKQPCLNSYCTIGSWVFEATYYGTFNGKIYCDNIVSDLKSPLTTLPELQKQHPGVFELQQIEVGDVVRTERFNETWFTELMKPLVGREGVVTNIVCDGIHVLHHGETLTFMWPRSACTLIRKPTPSFKAGQEGWKPDKGSDFEFYTPNDGKWIPCICYDYLENGEILGSRKDIGVWIVTSLDCIRPIPAQPTVESEFAELFRNLFNKKTTYGKAEKEAIAIANRYSEHQKHSGRVEVSVPTLDEIIEFVKADKRVTTVNTVEAALQHFMTRNEASK